jgi:catechol 2,3-dioxygenase-like lactoylglutathione lyase family enzyme
VSDSFNTPGAPARDSGGMTFLGLRTVIYPTPDLAATKAWFSSVLGFGPYFDEPFYVGFNVGGYELGLDPNADPSAGAITYWGVDDADAAVAALLDQGARERSAVQDVGDGIRVATVVGPAGSVVGVIENPHFHLAEPGG